MQSSQRELESVSKPRTLLTLSKEEARPHLFFEYLCPMAEEDQRMMQKPFDVGRVNDDVNVSVWVMPGVRLMSKSRTRFDDVPFLLGLHE